MFMEENKPASELKYMQIAASGGQNNVQREFSHRLTSIFRVFVASASKMFHRCPREVAELYERRENDLHKLPHTRGLRCLDKAAIILPDKALEEQERNRWRLCRVTEVEERKSLLRIIPMCMTFIYLGAIKALEFTFFLAQADHLNRKVGRLSVPFTMLMFFHYRGNNFLRTEYIDFANSLSKEKKNSMLLQFELQYQWLLGYYTVLRQQKWRLEDWIWLGAMVSLTSLMIKSP
ncbi:hypothetical protein Pint_35210 [Pistacia integerrima]|uniref:Uncharacterized protein n=1 Tax=Pistacia integerrima TaxID=434235 RepID=A0ACC0Y089_9ROSI|nr:hypothetical protein Pint_35210 [Pistacia integerrima]